MEQYITVLRLDEPARFNPDTLEHLCSEIGEISAEREVARALRVISDNLQLIERFNPRKQRAELNGPVRRIEVASRRIGMATLARVAEDVLTCLDSGDEVAISATYARLTRVGDRSIHAIWDLEDMSG